MCKGTKKDKIYFELLYNFIRNKITSSLKTIFLRKRNNVFLTKDNV